MSKQAMGSVGTEPSTRQEEARSFVFLAAVMVPALAVMAVAGFGFAVWVFQMFAGPPGA